VVLILTPSGKKSNDKPSEIKLSVFNSVVVRLSFVLGLHALGLVVKLDSSAGIEASPPRQ